VERDLTPAGLPAPESSPTSACPGVSASPLCDSSRPPRARRLREPALAAGILVDLDGHALGIAPGTDLVMDAIGPIIAFAIRSTDAMGTALRWSPPAVVRVLAEAGVIMAAPVPDSTLALALASDWTSGETAARRAILETCEAIRSLFRRNAEGAPRSLANLSAALHHTLTGLLENALLRLGCPRVALLADRRRRRVVGRLTRMARGAAGPAVEAYLRAICDASNLARPTRLLGTGSWGAAYLLADGRVLKLTGDIGEAHSAASLAGARGAYLVEVHEVWQYCTMGRQLGMFAIVRDEVEAAGALRGRDRSVADLVCHILLHAPRLGWNASVARAAGLPGAASQPELLLFAEREARALRGELMARQIAFGDFHTGNFGSKDGHLCLFDLSLSRGPLTVMPLRAVPDEVARRRCR
jgi:hypothetical protein